MIKRKNLETGTQYSNSLGESAFVGSRVEGKHRVTTMKVDVPYEDAITGEVFTVSQTTKVAVPLNALPADYAVAHEKANAYILQELPALGTADRAAFVAGAIEWTIEDIA